MIDLVENLRRDASALLTSLRHDAWRLGVRRKKRASQSKTRDYDHAHAPFQEVPKTPSFDAFSGSMGDAGERGVDHTPPG
jgi:hypothetical protein